MSDRQCPTVVDGDRRMIGGARVVKEAFSAGVDNKRRMASCARIVEFSVRTVPRCDRRLISRAVGKNFMKPPSKPPFILISLPAMICAVPAELMPLKIIGGVE